VSLVDKATFPRDKFCGDGLTTDALRRLEALGLDPAEVPSWQVVDEVRIRSPRGRVTAYPLPSGPGQHAAVARRWDLDAALVRMARAAGADVLEGHRLEQARQQADGVELEVHRADGPVTLRCDYVIGADGMWSPLRKALGVDQPSYRGEWHAFRQYWTDVSGPAERELWILFERELLPGYFWTFPLGNGQANVGFGILRGGRLTTHDMKRLWPELLDRSHVRALLGSDARPESPHRAWPIPARVDRTVLADGRALFVGDAAAATDPMTGEGIGQALATGQWAAEAVLAAPPSEPVTAARQYEAAVGRGLAIDHRLADALGRALATPAVTELALATTGLSPWTRRNFARWMFEDYPRAVLATPSRWHRDVFTGPGAFVAG
jgi:geranylgeranyl reductase family protein